jgi:hypothetical protein
MSFFAKTDIAPAKSVTQNDKYQKTYFTVYLTYLSNIIYNSILCIRDKNVSQCNPYRDRVRLDRDITSFLASGCRISLEFRF